MNDRRCHEISIIIKVYIQYYSIMIQNSSKVKMIMLLHQQPNVFAESAPIQNTCYQVGESLKNAINVCF